MWKRLLDIFVNIVAYAQRANALEQKVFNQEQEIKKLTDLTQRLVFELQRANDKIDRTSELEAIEREKLLLQVENQLLKSGRQLPPANDNEEKK